MTLLWQFANTQPQHFVYSGIIMEAMRNSWTDDRMDDLAGRVDAGIGRVHEDIAGLRTETHEDVAALRIDNKELRSDLARFDRDLRAATREELSTQVHAVRSEMREGFDRVDAQFNRVDAQFERVGAQFERIDARFDMVIATFNRRFDTLVMALIGAMLAGLVALLANHFG